MQLLKIFPIAIFTTILLVVLGLAVPKAQSLPQEVAEPTEGVDVPRLPKCKKGQTVGCTTM